MKRLITTAFILATACHKTDAQVAPADSSSAVAAASASAADSASPDIVAAVAPPDAVVAADPAIPLNEAVVGTAPLPADYSADVAPPAPVVEDQPPQAEADDTWVPGYWWWSRPLSRYVWVGGAWRRAPPNQFWTAGSWTPSNGRYFWAPGYWGPRGGGREMIDIAPPMLRAETPGAPPGEGFVWMPGYYGYQGGSYAWNPGSWGRPPSVGLGWVEPRYVNSGGHYFLQPGRWDFAAEHRGTVYSPNIDIHPGAHLALTPVPQRLVTAHVNFVSESSRAVARGAIRTPNGGFAIPGNPRPNEHVEPHEVVNVHDGVDPHPVEQRGAVGAPHVDEHAAVRAPEAHVEVRGPAPHEEVRHVEAPQVVHPQVAAPHPQERRRP